jgi:hypothetical protein
VTGPYITPLPYIATRSPEGLRVADGQKNWPIEPASDAERLVAPRVPVDRVMGVLKEIWRFLVDEAVGEFVAAVVGVHG